MGSRSNPVKDEDCAARGKEGRVCHGKIVEEAARAKAKTHV